MKRNNIKDESGSIIVEASIIIPLILFMIIFMLNIVWGLYSNYSNEVQAYANESIMNEKNIEKEIKNIYFIEFIDDISDNITITKEIKDKYSEMIEKINDFHLD